MRELRSIGISPDIIVPRSDHPVDDDLVDKIALFCDVDSKAIFPMVTTPILYEVPLLLEEMGAGDYVLSRLGLEARQKPDWTQWNQLVEKVRAPKPTVKIALVGKYVELHDAYLSVREAVKHAALHVGVEVDLAWVHSSDLEKGKGWDVLKNVDGIIVPGGFGSRGDRRQNPSSTLCAGKQGALFRLMSGNAIDGGGIRPPCVRQRPCQFDRIRPFDPSSGH